MAHHQEPTSNESSSDVPPSSTGNVTAKDSIINAGENVIINTGTYTSVVNHLPAQPQAPPQSTLTSQKRRNRAALLQKVRVSWIKGVLEKSLYNEALIELGLEARPDAVTQWNVIDRLRDKTPYALSKETQIKEVFEQFGGELLILGAPGAGKTTLLLELARDLITKAEQDENKPLPVVFNLSSWATERRPLAEWMVDELNNWYNVPRKLAQEWIEGDAIMPFLDGLDEVKKECRNACVEAINSYRRGRLSLHLIVCSRIGDYQLLATKLRLQGAVFVQPLTTEQVDDYFEKAGQPLANVQELIDKDPALRELLDTPLMLSIAAFAYSNEPATALLSTGTLDDRRHHLFIAYIKKMFMRKDVVKALQDKASTWLAWLAWQMQQRNQSVYYIEGIQRNWLIYQLDQQAVVLIVSLVYGLLFFLSIWMISNLFWGLVGGIFVLLSVVVFMKQGKISTIYHIRWSWAALRMKWRTIVSGGLYIGTFITLISGLFGDPGGGLVAGLFVGLLSAMGIAIGIGLGVGVPPTKLTISIHPNEGIHRALHNGLVIALVVSLIAGLIFGLIGGLSFGFYFGLASGLVAGLSFGFVAAGDHYAIRLIFWLTGVFPFRIIPFLDHCAELIFLRKVGGGYIFIHRMLLEHFAAMHIPRGFTSSRSSWWDDLEK